MDSMVKCLDKGFVRLVDSMGTDASIVQMARVSYGDGTKKISDDTNLIRYLMRHYHSSPFEGVSFKFHIKLPIFVSNQWVRHRTWSFNQCSARYSIMPDEFYVPSDEHITEQSQDNKQGGTNKQIHPSEHRIWNEHREMMGLSSDLRLDPEHPQDLTWKDIFEGEQQTIREFYQDHIDTGMRRELARINLPMSQYTEMYGVVDLHNLFHFLKLRLDTHAQYEIRVYAEAILELIRPIVPIAVQAFLDYRLNSISLSAKEFEFIKNCIDWTKFGNYSNTQTGLAGRELKEFYKKMSHE